MSTNCYQPWVAQVHTFILNYLKNEYDDHCVRRYTSPKGSIPSQAQWWLERSKYLVQSFSTYRRFREFSGYFEGEKLRRKSWLGQKMYLQYMHTAVKLWGLIINKTNATIVIYNTLKGVAVNDWGGAITLVLYHVS